jgi:hypothetical protein
MYRIVLGLVIILGLLLAFNVPVSGLIGPLVVLLIMASALSCILRGKLPRHFWAMVASLIIGPLLLCCLIKALLTRFENIPGLGLSRTTFVLVLLILMTISFLYVRARLYAGRRHNQRELHTSERQPVLPSHDEHEGEL